MRVDKPERRPKDDSAGEIAASRPMASVVLTNRERDVLELMTFGLTNKEISQRLGLGRRTIDTHVDHVLSKLDAPTRTRAVTEAARLGLIGSVPGSADSQPQLAGNNLPLQLTPLVGREGDVADIESLLATTRMLTLTGAGGVGKTRLAARVGFNALRSQPNGVWFVDFSPISDPVLVPSLAAKVLGLRESPRHDLSALCVKTLKECAALLIFDNCEHVIGSAAALAYAILSSCPNIKILATSRQPFGVPAEVVHRVPSLTVPEPDSGVGLSDASSFGAIELFVERAHAADSRFVLSDQNVLAVIEICRQLDGIPLALELAASRTSVMDIHALAGRLDDRFRLLTGGSRTALPRHKTLTALMDWSYDLLSPQEQKLLDRLSIFSGTFDLDAATAVCAGDGLESPELIDLVAELVNKSLVSYQTAGSHERYRLLETTRAYALEELEIAGERDRLTRRQAEYFLRRAQAADDRYGKGSSARWVAGVELDLENYRAALRWALVDGNDIPLGAGIVGSLERLWYLGGLAVEARGWFAAALERLSEHDQPAIAARLWRAKARFLQGKPMHDSAERAIALYRVVGDELGAAYALRSLAYSLLQMGKLDEGNDVINRAIAAFRDRNDDVGVASCLGLQGVSAYIQGDFTLGRRYYVKAVAACKALGDELATADVLGNFAELEFADGRPERALRLVSESLAITSGGKEMANRAIDHNNKAAYAIALGKLDEARESLREGLRWARLENNSWNIAVALQHLALIAALQGRTELAARLVGYVNERYESLGLERETTEQWAYQKLSSTLRERLTEEQLSTLGVEGVTLSEEWALEAADAI